MARDRVLVIDDEPHVRRAVRHALEAIGVDVREASTGQAGRDIAAAERPAMIVLDLGLPDLDGVAVCRDVRAWSNAPIIVLSARQAPQEKVALLDAGADDFVTKPFSTIELQARARAALRRARMVGQAPGDTILALDGLRIDFAKPGLTRDGDVVHLTKTEWQVLRALARHAGRTLTHRQLFGEVWGSASGDAQQLLRVYVRNLRRKIERDPVRPRWILTEPGVGYRFETGA